MLKNIIHLILICFFSVNIFSATAEPSVKWKKKEISICWGGNYQIQTSLLKTGANKGLYMDWIQKKIKIHYILSKEKLRIQNLIEQHFSQELIGRKFTGWKDCEANSNKDIIVWGIQNTELTSQSERYHLPGDETIIDLQKAISGKNTKNEVNYQVPSANVGNSHHHQELDNKNLEVTVKAYPEQSKGIVLIPSIGDLSIIHEFGHILGLRHEHIREEAKQDINCHDNFPQNSFTETYDVQTEFFSVYDKKSIMNYCYNAHLMKRYGRFLSKSKIKLSEYDKHALKCLYTYEQDDFDHKCHEDFKVD